MLKADQMEKRGSQIQGSIDPNDEVDQGEQSETMTAQ
jgi:hypothetical protein